ncbi:MAG: DUF485 domain-containing protein [Planctomycetales bacterium]|nr:DUF485 domain-containing protein [Planctomycetales bacterium]
MKTDNARLGIKLFLIYAAYYLAYVLVNAFAASWVEWKPMAGLNLAVLWGFSLIGLAFVMAVVYGLMCSTDENAAEPTQTRTREDRS